jgi:hypothetical protein
MKTHNFRHAIAELAEAATLQGEVAQDRLALEWGQLLFTQLVRLWDCIETHESLAYEDKVAAQIRVLDEATTTLWRLHRTLAQTRRLLKRHQQNLRHRVAPVDP